MYTLENIPVFEGEMGDSLISLFQQNGVFDDKRLSEEKQVELLEDILNDEFDDDNDILGPIDARAFYSVGDMFQMPYEDAWAVFVRDVRKHPDELLPIPEEFDVFLSRSQISVPPGTIYHRARRGCNTLTSGDEPYRGAEIGAPSPDKVNIPAGRANRKGESFLYCAEEEITAIAELRPPRGYILTVCPFSLVRSAQVLDLCKNLEPINPFLVEKPLHEIGINNLLRAFGEEMSHPVERDVEKDKEENNPFYIPTQRLCEYIQKMGYDGIRYLSALNRGGSNLVFFDRDIAAPGDSKLVKVTLTEIQYEQIETGLQALERLRKAYKAHQEAYRSGAT